MKKILTAWLVGVMAILPQAFAEPGTIHVSGNAEVKVVPDDIQMRIGVETRDAKLETARQDSSSRVSKILAFLKSKEIADKFVQTDVIQIEPVYRHEGEQITPTFFRVTTSLHITLKDIAKFDSVLAGCLDAGATHVHGVEFHTSELRKHRDEARRMAIRAAKEKAEALVAELGVKCGKPQSINAHEGGGWLGAGSQQRGMVQNAMMDGAGGAEATATSSLGLINVGATVNVTFAIE